MRIWSAWKPFEASRRIGIFPDYGMVAARGIDNPAGFGEKQYKLGNWFGVY